MLIMYHTDQRAHDGAGQPKKMTSRCIDMDGHDGLGMSTIVFLLCILYIIWLLQEERTEVYLVLVDLVFGLGLLSLGLLPLPNS